MRLVIALVYVLFTLPCFANPVCDCSRPGPAFDKPFDWLVASPWEEALRARPAEVVPPPSRDWASLWPEQPVREYGQTNLEYVRMPIGGIGTGTLWLDGQGRIAVAQIANNLDERRLENTFFALRVQSEGAQPLTRLLQTVSEFGLTPMGSALFEGGYPIGGLHFRDDSFPVRVDLEGWNPFLPTDAATSSLPCAVFRFTLKNTTDRPVRAELLGSLGNQVTEGDSARQSVAGRGFRGVLLSQPEKAIQPGRLGLVAPCGTPLEAGELLWLDATGLTTLEELVASDPVTIARLTKLRASGGVLLLSGVSHDLTRDAQSLWNQVTQAGKVEIFEDFEGEDFGDWKLTGGPFGGRPSHGTEASQQTVSGFLGGGLLNTYITYDEPQGALTSPEFTLTRPYIGLLVGGGGYAGKTCVNLLVDGQVVLSATGNNTEQLHPVIWDVSKYLGKQAQIEAVDRESVGWGHILLDEIVFADRDPTAWYSLLEPARSLAEALASGQSEVALGKGKALVALGIAFAPDEIQDLFLTATNAEPGARLRTFAPDYGTLVLASTASRTESGGWSSLSELADFERTGRLPGAARQPANAALASFIPLAPGESATVSYFIAWHFPNGERFGHEGNLYATRFADAKGVADYLGPRLEALWQRSKLWQTTVQQSNLPAEWLDAAQTNNAVLRGPTCCWSADGYFGGYEGSYGCCPLNCTHVWNYAQNHARLFPEIGRNMRASDLLVFLHQDGETSHRQHIASSAFIDGHCATLCAALREYQTSADESFLARIWPQAQLAIEWLIGRLDADRDGVPSGRQPNTYDCDVSGANTFIGSQYLAALLASARLAELSGEPKLAAEWRALARLGGENQDRLLWNGEYYLQRPDDPPANDYGPGCHSDQLLGQWWAYQLGLGELYPTAHRLSACEAIFKHNFRKDFVGFQQRPRRYCLDTDSGLLMCTWPKGGRPDPFIIYADEVWTGIEYSTAGLFIWEGLEEEARTLVEAARDRYDGVRRDGVDSGPGGNPYCELECGKFYARAQSSWGLLLAAQGFELDGPRGRIGFKPNWQPADHRSVWTGPEGWGLFLQRRAENRQWERLELRAGKLQVKELVFEAPAKRQIKTASAKVGSQKLASSFTQSGQEVCLKLAKPLPLADGDALEVLLSW